MKAMSVTAYGPPDVLRLVEIEKPSPGDHEVLIRVHATPVNYGDLTARNFGNITPREFNMPMPLWLPARLAFGFKKPRRPVLGNELAGMVEGVGKHVRNFRIGDQVFAYSGMNMGADAEYVCMPEDGMVAVKPSNMTYEEASAVPYGGITALCLLRKAAIKGGHKVLINGASGGIGSMAVQLAKEYGAEVTAVCGTPRLEYVKSLGADKVIDYTREDFTGNGERYNLIFDILGRSSFSRCRGSLTPNGTYLLASFKTKQLFQMLWTSVLGGRKVICALSDEKREDLILLKELVENGKIKTVIDRCFPLEQTAEAHRYIERGMKRGQVIITI
jgi:NADPH:quinone reductase-like Zn-dependent oxidoreductase